MNGTTWVLFGLDIACKITNRTHGQHTLCCKECDANVWTLHEDIKRSFHIHNVTKLHTALYMIHRHATFDKLLFCYIHLAAKCDVNLSIYMATVL